MDGQISESCIRLSVLDGLANSFSAHFSGRFVEVDGGSVLEGEFHHTLMTRIHLIVSRSFLIVLGVAMSGGSLYGLIATGKIGLILGVIFPLAFTTGCCILITRNSRLDTRRLDHFIRSAIE